MQPQLPPTFRILGFSAALTPLYELTVIELFPLIQFSSLPFVFRIQENSPRSRHCLSTSVVSARIQMYTPSCAISKWSDSG